MHSRRRHPLIADAIASLAAMPFERYRSYEKEASAERQQAGSSLAVLTLWR